MARELTVPLDGLLVRCRLKVPMPLGRYGQGFVTDLCAQPAWDVSAPTPFVLFKGRRLESLKVRGCVFSVSVAVSVVVTV